MGNRETSTTVCTEKKKQQASVPQFPEQHRDVLYNELKDKYLETREIELILQTVKRKNVNNPLIVCISTKKDNYSNILNENQTVPEYVGIIDGKTHRNIKKQIIEILNKDLSYDDANYDGLIILLICFVSQTNEELTFFYDANEEGRDIEKLKKDIIYRLDDLFMQINFSKAVFVGDNDSIIACRCSPGIACKGHHDSHLNSIATHDDASCVGISSIHCKDCNKQCCYRCKALNIVTFDGNHSEYQCKECFLLSQYQYLLSIIKLVFESIFREKPAELNVIRIIAKYAVYHSGQCNRSNCKQFSSSLFGKELILDNILDEAYINWSKQPIMVMVENKYNVRCVECDNNGLDKNDIELIMDQAQVSRYEAVLALRDMDGDIIEAVMKLTM